MPLNKVRETSDDCIEVKQRLFPVVIDRIWFHAPDILLFDNADLVKKKKKNCF